MGSKPRGAVRSKVSPSSKRRSSALWDCYHGEPCEARKSAAINHGSGAQRITGWSNDYGQTCFVSSGHRRRASIKLLSKRSLIKKYHVIFEDRVYRITCSFWRYLDFFFPRKRIGSMKITFTSIEIKEIVLSAIVLSVAFAIAYSDGIFNLNLSTLPTLVLFAFIAVGIGFLAHELIGHKIVAQRLGLHAEYKMWKFGLVIALLSSAIGFVFAAPGAVYVSSRVDLWGRASGVSKRKMGFVSLAGPLVNIGLAAVFFLLNLLYPIIIDGVSLFSLAVFINVWLGIFNMLPIPPLDGSKVFAWDKRIWIATFAVLIMMFFAL